MFLDHRISREDARLQIHSNSTATADNMEEIRRLTTFLFDRCPQMSHHNLALIRGDRKNPSLQGPELEAYQRFQHRVATSGEGIVYTALVWRKLRAFPEELANLERAVAPAWKRAPAAAIALPSAS